MHDESSQVLYVRLPTPLHDALRRRAERHHLTISQLATAIVNGWLLGEVYTPPRWYDPAKDDVPDELKCSAG